MLKNENADCNIYSNFQNHGAHNRQFSILYQSVVGGAYNVGPDDKQVFKAVYQALGVHCVDPDEVLESVAHGIPLKGVCTMGHV